jgi:hypothetical protein
MAAIYSNGGNRWNILGFNFTKRDALSSVYKISMAESRGFTPDWVVKKVISYCCKDKTARSVISYIYRVYQKMYTFQIQIS